jgi:hypothetical protein
LDSTSWICHWAWRGILRKLTFKRLFESSLDGEIGGRDFFYTLYEVFNEGLASLFLSKIEQK